MRKLKVKNKKVLIIGAVIVVACVGAGVLFFLKRNNGGMEDTAKVQKAVAEKGTISNTIVGTGNLELKASESVQIPSGITVKEVKVESGDAVSEGDVLATVDKTSVLEVLSTVQESIEDIDDQINDCKNGDDTETVTASVSGTIQKIYAKKGDSVTERIAKNGALLVISASDTGDKMEVIAGSGTVSKIHVSKGQSVSAGTKLFTIINDENSEKYAVLLSQREELAETAQKLAQMVQTGKITADQDGTVVDVNVTDSTDSNGTSGSSGSSVSNMSSSVSNMNSSVTGDGSGESGSTYKIMTLSSASGTSDDTDADDDNEESEEEKTLSLAVAGSDSSSASKLVVAAPVTGEKPQTSIYVSDGSYSGSIVWNPSADTFAAETTYRAEITLQAADGYVFTGNSITKTETGTLSGVTVSGDGKTATFTITFPETAADSNEEESSSDGKDTGNSSDSSGSTDSTNGDGADSSAKSSGTESSAKSSGAESSGSGSTASASAKSGSTGSTSSTGSSAASSGSSSDSETSSASITEVTAFTLATDDTMLLSVNVDELDINSVAEDQEAEITLDAIEDEAFTGTVTKVSASASSTSGSSAKYVVEISLEKDDQIKAGMNASATIVVEKKEDVLTIPVNALQEKGRKVFVYTEQDDEGNLSGETEVTTGISDGSTVEITDGLSEGDTVYYQKSGNISGDSSGQMNGGFGDGDGGMSGKGGMSDGGGDMPFGENGGNMPSGERRGDN